MENKPEAQASTTPATGGSREQIALTRARGGILGVKAGMTQVFTEDGDSVAVTVWKSLKLAGVDPSRVQGWGRVFAAS